jgi:hypothetical protein
MFLYLSCVFCVAEEKVRNDFDMKKKLEFSKNILDGLVKEDYQKILKNAKSLNEMGKRKWLENESVEYRTQNQVFWFTTGSLRIAAEEKNMDGATLAYMQMTLSCVNCHKQLRR